MSVRSVCLVSVCGLSGVVCARARVVWNVVYVRYVSGMCLVCARAPCVADGEKL